MSEEKQVLTDPMVMITDEVLKEALGDNYSVYEEFLKKLEEFSIEPIWRYYKDSKAWLGKCEHKKKTVFWLSVWDGYFKISLFFTEKTAEGVLDLKVNKKFKTFEPNWAKLKPIVISVRQDTDLNDLFKVIEYKRNLK